LRQIVDGENAESMQRPVAWAASLHEIGITVAYNGYHKHSAYILRNADMPGFSRAEQEQLALLVLAHRGQLRKLGEFAVADDDWPSVVALRLATLFSRSRVDATFPEFSLRRRNDAFILGVPAGWLADNPLTETALREEVKLWRGCGHSLDVRVTGAQVAGAALPSAT
jgi:exopolyphosphatase/guanosine-5'-triphosphate,3'-diphosphate pyrophosphatase